MTFEVNIKVKGKTIPSYFHEGDTWIEGRIGSEYTLEFKNKTNKNVLIIPSVDGLSTLDGKAATENSKGYIVYAHSTIEIPGWTLDNSNVAKFVFSNVDNSYSTYQSGNSDNNGVIGFKVFYEKDKPVEEFYKNFTDFPSLNNTIPLKNVSNSIMYGETSILRNLQSSDRITITASNYSDVDHSVGTGFGDQTEFNVSEVEFERGFLADTIVIYYDSLKNLKARGIKIEPQKSKPQPFKTIGCIPPKNWQK